jgi:hypothetical protein
MLPYIQSYTDAKKEKAYRRYMDGQAQRKVAASLKISPRTLASWSKADGWEAERKARKIAAETPEVAAAAAGGAVEQHFAATPPADAPPETRAAGMERMLGQQQRLAGILMTALRKDIEGTVEAAAAAGKTLSRSQISQLTTLSNNLCTLERKAWCVPDKLETKDTTPTPEDRLRKLTDDDLDRELAEAERAATSSAQREAPQESVH